MKEQDNLIKYTSIDILFSDPSKIISENDLSSKQLDMLDRICLGVRNWFSQEKIPAQDSLDSFFNETIGQLELHGYDTTGLDELLKTNNFLGLLEELDYIWDLFFDESISLSKVEPPRLIRTLVFLVGIKESFGQTGKISLKNVIGKIKKHSSTARFKLKQKKEGSPSQNDPYFTLGMLEISRSLISYFPRNLDSDSVLNEDFINLKRQYRKSEVLNEPAFWDILQKLKKLDTVSSEYIEAMLKKHQDLYNGIIEGFTLYYRDSGQVLAEDLLKLEAFLRKELSKNEVFLIELTKILVRLIESSDHTTHATAVPSNLVASLLNQSISKIMDIVEIPQELKIDTQNEVESSKDLTPIMKQIVGSSGAFRREIEPDIRVSQIRQDQIKKGDELHLLQQTSEFRQRERLSSDVLSVLIENANRDTRQGEISKVCLAISALVQGNFKQYKEVPLQSYFDLIGNIGEGKITILGYLVFALIDQDHTEEYLNAISNLLITDSHSLDQTQSIQVGNILGIKLEDESAVADEDDEILNRARTRIESRYPGLSTSKSSMSLENLIDQTTD